MSISDNKNSRNTRKEIKGCLDVLSAFSGQITFDEARARIEKRNRSPKTYPKGSESIEQRAVIRWCKRHEDIYPQLKYIYHIPNEGKRKAYAGKRLKDEGLRAGVSDLCLPVPNSKHIGLYIEMKYGKNKLTEKQSEWLEAMSKFGHFADVCYSAEEAVRKIERYIKNEI